MWVPPPTLTSSSRDSGSRSSNARTARSDSGYARSTDEARERVRSGDVQAGLFMGPAPVELVREVAAAGEVMPPKSTYFFPKVLTGLLFNPLED